MNSEKLFKRPTHGMPYGQIHATSHFLFLLFSSSSEPLSLSLSLSLYIYIYHSLSLLLVQATTSHDQHSLVTKQQHVLTTQDQMAAIWRTLAPWRLICDSGRACNARGHAVASWRCTTVSNYTHLWFKVPIISSQPPRHNGILHSQKKVSGSSARFSM